MILGFAHITKNEPFWLPGLSGEPIPNAPEKWPLMERQASSQLLRLSEFAGLTVETSAYNTGVVKQQGRIEFGDDGCVWLPSRDRARERQFLCDGLGFHPH